jgi:hypothetical protein
MTLRSRRADEIIYRRYGRVLTNQELADVVRRTPVLRRRSLGAAAVFSRHLLPLAVLAHAPGDVANAVREWKT